MNDFDWRRWDGELSSVLDYLEMPPDTVESVAERAAEKVRWQFIRLAEQVDSPIELKLLLHLVCVKQAGKYMFPDVVDVVRRDTSFKTRFVDEPHIDWLTIELQKPVGKYRCDFEVKMSSASPRGVTEAVVYVEADGHSYHERTKEQARHDKQRDRFFASQGLTVLRFTGSEIHRNASRCAAEVLELLTKKSVAAFKAMEPA